MTAPPRGPWPVTAALWLYRKLADAFPQEFRNIYGEELMEMTDDAIDGIWQRHGFRGLARLLLDIALRVPAEYLAEMRQDIRYCLRSLAASPGFTLVALVSLSLGMCIATCAISEMNGFALRTLPGVADPGQLVAVQSPTSYAHFRRFREQRGLLSATAAYVAPVPFAISFGGSSERVWGHLVTPGYFALFGVRPALGSFFHAVHESPGQPPAVVVSHRFWRDRLNGDPGAIGQPLRINGHSVTVLGVAPDEFRGASPLLFGADLWMPVTVDGAIAPELAGNALERPDLQMFFVAGRLTPGISQERAESGLDAVSRQVDEDNGIANSGPRNRLLLVEGGRMLPLRKQDLPFFTSFLTIVAALILLIACANVANMMLARAAGRKREIAVRLALGASRGRIVRQLLTESLLVALAAGAVGFSGSVWLMRLMSQVPMPFPMPVAFDFHPDSRVLAFTFLLSIATGVLFGLTPALQCTRAAVLPSLKGSDESASRGRRLFSTRRLLMVSQIAGSLTLLVVLGLLSIGIQSTLGIQTGFNAANLYLVTFDPVRDGYSPARAAAFLERLLDRTRTLPGITAAALTETVPVSMPGTSVNLSSPQEANSPTTRAIKHVVGAEYFATTGIALLSGRGFRKDDTAQSVIISEAAAHELWGNTDAAGRAIEIGNAGAAPPKVLPGSYDLRPTIDGSTPRRYTVIGVAANVAEGLVAQKPRPAVYFPLAYTQPALTGVTLIARAAPGVDALNLIRQEGQKVDSAITPFHARTMGEQIDQFMGALRMAAWTYGVIGIFGLVLAAVGLAGVTAYSIARRRREIGIRMALGARDGAVLWLVMREGFVTIAAGTALGLAGASAGARLLAAMNSTVGRVTSTSTSDPAVLLGAPLLLAALALAACYIPARRSVEIDPAITLRDE